MRFDQEFYKFIYCKTEIPSLVAAAVAATSGNSSWVRLRTCPFSMDLINEQFRQNAVYYHPPKSMMIFFSPRLNPKNTVGIITGGFSWEYWLGKRTPNLETMTFRFTPDTSGENAIRELALLHGSKLIRMIRVMKNPRWELCNVGDQQPFEGNKSYKKIKGKPIRNYFMMDDMIRFATSWECPFDKEGFWDSDKLMYCLGEIENDETLANWTEHPDGFPWIDAIVHDKLNYKNKVHENEILEDIQKTSRKNQK
jgi:hypothetical protein